MMILTWAGPFIGELGATTAKRLLIPGRPYEFPDTEAAQLLAQNPTWFRAVSGETLYPSDVLYPEDELYMA